jgi:hypothetical protein
MAPSSSTEDRFSSLRVKAYTWLLELTDAGISHSTEIKLREEGGNYYYSLGVELEYFVNRLPTPDFLLLLDLGSWHSKGGRWISLF